MRTIGNIERFLVLGIVVVIGAILTVAITGARDLDQLDKERPNVASAKGAVGSPAGKSGTKKGSVPAKSEPLGGKPTLVGAEQRKDLPLEVGPGGARRPAAIDPDLKKLLDARDAALHGAPPPATPTAPPADPQTGTGFGKAAIADAPEILDDGFKPEPTGLKKNDSIVPAGPADRPLDAGSVATKSYVYQVQKGDTLERIARALYGDGLQWKAILAANPDKGDGHTIRPGDHLKLPKAPTHESAFVAAEATNAANDGRAATTPRDRTTQAGALRDAAPADASGQSGKSAIAPPATSGGFKRTSSRDQYQVQKGDTLMSIAAANYGTKSAWKLILDANSDAIPDKDRIKPGVVLKLPPN